MLARMDGLQSSQYCCREVLHCRAVLHALRRLFSGGRWPRGAAGSLGSSSRVPPGDQPSFHTVLSSFKLSLTRLSRSPPPPPDAVG